MLDTKELAAGLLKTVQDWIAPTIKDIDDRFKSLAEAIKAIPAGPQGERGEIGLKGDPGDRGEKGDAGLQGERGADGVSGKDGRDGIDGKDGAPGLQGERGEIGQKGDPGDRGEKGEKGEQGPAGESGKDGAPGLDGKSITVDDVQPMLEVIVAKWELDFERRAQDILQRAIDKFPAPKDGRDAFNLEDLSVEHDGDGGVTLKFSRGELVKEFKLRLPRFKVKGGFREGFDYLEGDGVSFGGSFYIAQKDAPQGKPGDTVSDWWQAAKKGRDGKDMTPGETVQRLPVKLQ